MNLTKRDFSLVLSDLPLDDYELVKAITAAQKLKTTYKINGISLAKTKENEWVILIKGNEEKALPSIHYGVFVRRW